MNNHTSIMNYIFQKNANRLHGLDHLRSIAIIMVMIFHFGRGIPSWLEPVKQIGWSGVDLFFVLSGFLIGNILLKEIRQSGSIDFKQFYTKRFFRIIPAFIVVLILYYALPNLRDGSGMPPLWKFLTFTQNLSIDYVNQRSFSHAWSLCIEEQFYLLLPLSLMVLFYFRAQKAAPYIIISFVLLGLLLRIYLWNYSVQPFIDEGNRRGMFISFLEKIYYPSYGRMDGLLVGLGIAALQNFRPKLMNRLGKYGNIQLVVGLLVFGFAYWLCPGLISKTTAIYGFPIISLAYGIIVMAAISPSCILHKFKSRITFSIATLSYSLYLIHKLLFHICKTLISKYNLEQVAPYTFWICMLISVAGAFILYIGIEKPFLNFRERILESTGKGDKIVRPALLWNRRKPK